jgi:hypothetical protein
MEMLRVSKLPRNLRSLLNSTVSAAREEAYKVKLRGRPRRSTVCEVFESPDEFRTEAIPECAERKCPITGALLPVERVTQIIDNYLCHYPVQFLVPIVHIGCGNFFSIAVASNASHIWLNNRCTDHGMIPCAKNTSYDTFHTYGSWCRVNDGQDIR